MARHVFRQPLVGGGPGSHPDNLCTRCPAAQAHSPPAPAHTRRCSSSILLLILLAAPAHRAVRREGDLYGFVAVIRAGRCRAVGDAECGEGGAVRGSRGSGGIAGSGGRGQPSAGGDGGAKPVIEGVVDGCCSHGLLPLRGAAGAEADQRGDRAPAEEGQAGRQEGAEAPAPG